MFVFIFRQKLENPIYGKEEFGNIIMITMNTMQFDCKRIKIYIGFVLIIIGQVYTNIV